MSETQSQQARSGLESSTCSSQLDTQLSKLNSLANRLRDSYRQSRSLGHLEKAIEALRTGLSKHPRGADRTAFLNDLAGALWERYHHNGKIADLDESIKLLEDALAHCSTDHPLLAETLNNFSICLQDKYKEEHSLDVLNKAIKIQEAALFLRPEGHPDRSRSLTNLGLLLRDRFKENGSPEDLDSAISYNRASVALQPEGHSLRPSSLSNLAIALQYRYEVHGYREDIQESIRLLRATLSLYPPRHSERPTALLNLSISLRYKFRLDGAIADLNEAIDILLPFKERGTLRHPVWLLFMSSLSSLLEERFNHLGALVDFDEAILLQTIVVEICPYNHVERSMFLHNLGNKFQRRFTLQGGLCDLEKATEYHQKALDLRPHGHLQRSSSLDGLALCYRERFDHLAEIDDFVKAIEYYRAALQLQSEGHVFRPRSLEGLAHCFLSRFTVNGTPSDLTTAIELFTTTLSLRPVGDPLRTHCLHYLALCLQRRFEHFRSKDDLEEVFRLYSELSESKGGILSDDIRAARAWANVADKFSHSSTMTAYRTTLNFLARHTAIFPPSVERYNILKEYAPSLAVDTFSYCIRQGDIKTAVELLEQGRAMFWTQLAHLDTPLDGLSSLGSGTTHLAEEFKRVSMRLRNVFDQAAELQSAQTRKLITELEDIISRIRTVPGFSRFLLAPEFADLQTTAIGGPVVIVNASRYSCDALVILFNKDPIHIRLGVSKTQLSMLVSQFRRVVDDPTHFSVSEIGGMLRQVWECAVEPVVGALQQHGVAPNSRIWWCPTGEFTSLPLHAAGAYRKGQQNLPDLYVSSYTPTLGALLRARKQSRQSSLDNPPFAIIGTSKPLDEVSLPSVPAELALVADRVRDHACITLLAEDDATIAHTTDALERCEWLHLACHGILDAAHGPFKSCFALHDGQLTLGRLVQSGSFSGSTSSDFVFLSACRTTVSDPRTPDEMIHLAAAMQFGGFRSIVGSVLPVEDSVAGRVVDAFYTRLLSGTEGRLDCSMAAVALHKALRSLRGKIPFHQQIVFVHIGI